MRARGKADKKYKSDACDDRSTDGIDVEGKKSGLMLSKFGYITGNVVKEKQNTILSRTLVYQTIIDFFLIEENENCT
jgi:hypothetical protein